MSDTLSLNEIKEIELELLRYIDKICHENEIPYFLDSGTLLGAVRHKGFIPWDDDIDIVIDRKDYKKLLMLLDNGSDRFNVLSMYNTEGYQYTFAKLVDSNTKLIEHNTKSIEEMGVFIDLFPMEHLPNRKLSRRIVQAYVKWLRSIESLLYNDTSDYTKLHGKYKVFCFPYIKLGWQGVQKKLDIYLENLALKDTDYLVQLLASSNPYRDVKKDYFEKAIDLQFEGETFKAPIGYKKYLEILYGDYMSLPPEDKRVSNHDFSVYHR